MSTQTQEKTRYARELTLNVDIFENENELLIVADAPGLDPNDIDIQVDLPELRIAAKVPGSSDHPVVYARTFGIDERIDQERVKAEYKHGVLSVQLAKSAAFHPRRVAVQGS